MLFGPTSNNSRCDLIAESRIMFETNMTGKRLLNQHPKPEGGGPGEPKIDFNSTRQMFAAEDISVAMIGPVVVARIFITLFGTLLPFIIQSRRRRVVLAALRARMRKYGLTGGMLFRRKRKSEALLNITELSKGTTLATGNGSDDNDNDNDNDNDKGKGKGNQNNGNGIESKSNAKGASSAKVAPAISASPRPGGKTVSPIKPVSPLLRAKDKNKSDPSLAKFVDDDISKIVMIQNLYRGLRARRLKMERLMALKQADELIEESALEKIDQQGIYQDVLVQITIVTLFSATSPWIPLVMGVLGAIDSRVRITALLFSYKKTVPRK